MSSPSDNPKRWLEEELRNVPLPEGLTARLKGIAGGTDEELDIALRDVAVPSSLLADLKAIPADAELDRKLRTVEVPAGLAARLRDISAWTEDELDAQLADVEVPESLEANLKSLARVELRTEQVRRQNFNWVLAASLLIAVSLAYFAAAGGLVASMARSGGMFPQPVAVADGNEPLELEVELLPVEVSEEIATHAFVSSTSLPPLGETAPVVAQVEVEFLPVERPLPGSSLIGQVSELFSNHKTGYVDPLTDLFLAKHDFLATPVVDTVPVLKTVDPLPVRGVTPPLIPASQWQSLIVDGKFPFVSPGASSQLATARVPLTSTTLGYDLAWRDLLAGEMPSGNLLRTEDFLASLNYGFEAPRRSALGLRTAAGPAPFAEEGLSLLQIGVPAIAVAHNQPKPIQLTLAIDGSASMSESGQLAQLRRVFSQLDGVLSPKDRLSVVVLGQTTEVLLENAPKSDWSQLARLLETLPAQQGSNLAGGLREAALVARGAANPAYRQRLVLIADGLRDASPAIVQRLESMAADLAQEAMPVDVLQLLPLEAEVDAGLRDVAGAGRGRLYPAESAEAIRSALVEIAAGPDQLVASSATLQVTFRPEAVAEYRLIGHEPSGGGGLVGGPLEMNLHAGQTSTALFEVKLKSTGGDEIGTAVLTWKDPTTGKEHTARQRISRLQFATSVLETPVSLQRAAIAAQAAEVLRLSRSSSARTLGLKRLAQQAGQLPAYTRNEPAFQQMLSLIDLALQVQTGRIGK